MPVPNPLLLTAESLPALRVTPPVKVLASFLLNARFPDPFFVIELVEVSEMTALMFMFRLGLSLFTIKEEASTTGAVMVFPELDPEDAMLMTASVPLLSKVSVPPPVACNVQGEEPPKFKVPTVRDETAPSMVTKTAPPVPVFRPTFDPAPPGTGLGSPVQLEVADHTPELVAAFQVPSTAMAEETEKRTTAARKADTGILVGAPGDGKTRETGGFFIRG